MPLRCYADYCRCAIIDVAAIALLRYCLLLLRCCHTREYHRAIRHAASGMRRCLRALMPLRHAAHAYGAVISLRHYATLRYYFAAASAADALRQGAAMMRHDAAAPLRLRAILPPLPRAAVGRFIYATLI